MQKSRGRNKLAMLEEPLRGGWGWAGKLGEMEGDTGRRSQGLNVLGAVGQSIGFVLRLTPGTSLKSDRM